MREAINFTFDGIPSEQMGVQVTSVDSGLFEESFLPSRNILETTIRGRSKPYFQGIEEEPLSFTFSIFIRDWEIRDNLKQIARWLYKDYYKPLYFDTNPERIYYAMIEGESYLTHNGLKEGYVTLNIRCNSPYAYSPKKTIENVESRVGVETQIGINNEGDIVVKPKMWITKKENDGDISIENRETGEFMKIVDLQKDEEVFVDCENEEIISSLEYVHVYRYDDHNNTWISLAVDDNYLRMVGDFDVRIEYELVYLTDY